jgi:hypothetical protein
MPTTCCDIPFEFFVTRVLQDFDYWLVNEIGVMDASSGNPLLLRPSASPLLERIHLHPGVSCKYLFQIRYCELCDGGLVVGGCMLVKKALRPAVQLCSA